MFFGVGSVVGPEPMFGQRCSDVPALAVGLGPSSFARSSPNRYARWRQQGDTHPRPPRSSRWVPPPHRGSVVPGGEASSPASESAGPWPDFSPILLHFSTASSSLLMPPDMQGSPRLSWRLKRAVPADAKRKLELKLESDVRPAEQIDVHACRRCSWAVLWWNLLWLLRITPHGGNRNYFFHWVIKIPLATRLMVHVPRKEAVKPSPFFPPFFLTRHLLRCRFTRVTLKYIPF